MRLASSGQLQLPPTAMHSHCGDILSREGVGRVADQQASLPHGTVERGSAHVAPGPSLRPFPPRKGSQLPQGRRLVWVTGVG